MGTTEQHLHFIATVTSKGQVTIPKSARAALEIVAGDRIAFNLEGEQLVIRRVPNFLELAGSVETPPELEGKSFDEIRQLAWRAEARP